MKRLITGIYRLYSDDGWSYVGFSHNLEGTRKRLEFELKLNACSYKPLQESYNKNEGHLEFEILETYLPNDDMSDEEIDAHLRAKLIIWRQKLGNARLIQTSI